MLIERAYVDVPEGEGTAENGWPWTVPCVRQLAEEGLAFRAPVTFLVGENGSGKSTLVEALAEGFGLDSYGGSAGYKYASSRERVAARRVGCGSIRRGRGAGWCAGRGSAGGGSSCGPRRRWRR